MDSSKNLDLIKCNEKFYDNIQKQYICFGNLINDESKAISTLRSDQEEIAELSMDELKEYIDVGRERLEEYARELFALATSSDEDRFDKRREILLEIKELETTLLIFESEYELRHRVDSEINEKIDKLKPANTPEKKKRISELEKSRENRYIKERDNVEFERLSRQIKDEFQGYRNQLLTDIADQSRMQVKFINKLFKENKFDSEEKIYEAINQLLTKKMDDEILDEIVFKAVYEELSRHSDLFIVWNSYNELKMRKDESTPLTSGDGGTTPPTPPIGGDGGTTPPIPPTGGDGGTTPPTPPTGGDGGTTPPTPPTGGDGGTTPPTPPIGGDSGDIPQNIKNAPALTWKTALSIAAGIGLGAGVFFAFGGAGVAVLSISGMIGKLILNKKRKKLIEKRLSGQVEVQSTEEPRKGLKGAIDKFRKYINSEEGVRDLSALLSASIITGNSINLIDILSGGAISTWATNVYNGWTDGGINNPTVSNTGATSGTQYVDGQSVVLGNGTGSHNLTTGYDSAAYSVTRSNAESLIPEYINSSDSMFKEFAIMDSTGQNVLQRISTPGLSAADAASKFGVPLEQIAVNVGRAADGADQAWISVNELIGKSGRIV